MSVLPAHKGVANRVSALLARAFLLSTKRAFVDDKRIVQFRCKSSPSWAGNGLIETAVPTNLPAELSNTGNGAIHDPLSHSSTAFLHSLARSPGQCSANHHASSRAHQVHVRCPTTRPAPPACMKTMAQASSPPFCGTQLAEICGVEHEVRVTSGAPRLSAPYNKAQLGPPGLEGIKIRLPGPRREKQVCRRPTLHSCAHSLHVSISPHRVPR